MKEGTTRTVVDESFVQFFNSFHSIAEKTSGTLALAIIQCLVMVAAVVKKGQVHGVMYWGLTFVALVSTLGFFVCFLSIINVIAKQDNCGRWIKSLIFSLYISAYIGTLLSAIATIISLNG
ncbi:hypothetical protein [Enterobacter hormaechei]|uniref:hypothetical protein n=1 Tax=Enterobacter hormaechei TaxID=158836 RepID=UPI001C8F4AB5|nr:hypothetical protein [Enterobacter hormaechei]